MTAQADLERRNALLDELKKAVDDWAETEEEKKILDELEKNENLPPSNAPEDGEN